jgi:class 3 adenylate cyclase
MTSERDQLVAAIAALEGQRALLGDAVVEAALGPMRAKLATLHAPQGEQRKQISVLFADVSGFTARSEAMDPEELRAEMNALWQRLDAAILDHGGRIDKHIGDAVMALWGTDTAREDGPERAILAALAMQGFLSTSAPTPGATPESSHVPRPALALRIGINTGLALLGEVGTTGEFTAMGDAINVASRLEQAAAPGTILISHDTYRHVRGVFRVIPQPPLTVKGKTDPLTVYIVVEAEPRAFRAPNRGIEGIETHLVGREAELRRLQDAFLTTVQTGSFQQVTLIGQAGLGKSRLLDEFRRWMEARPEPHRLFLGLADVDLSGQPYGLLRDLLFTSCAIQHSDPLTIARAKLEAGLAGFLAQSGERDAGIVHLLGQLIGLDFSASSHLAGIVSDAQQLRDRAFTAASRFFQAVAATRPAVLLLEDLQWADDGSLDLLDHLARELPRTRLLVVGLTRPTLLERRPDWAAGRPGQARLPLAPLSMGETEQLVEALLQRAEVIPPALRDLIVARAEGNPYYVEELIRMLIDEGAIQTSGERWVVMPERLEGVQVPPTLTGVVQARLDALPIAERETLKRAAVVGQVFWDSAVVTLAETADTGAAFDDRAEGTRRALQALPGRELVLCRVGSAFGGTTEYTFQHALGREVAYEQLEMAWERARMGERPEQAQPGEGAD